MSKKRGLNHYKGAQLVKKQQRAREQFYKRYSAGKWRMDMGKDLVVNRAKLGRQGCVDVIAAAYRSKLRELGLTETGQAPRTVIDDDTLHVAAEVG